MSILETITLKFRKKESFPPLADFDELRRKFVDEQKIYFQNLLKNYPDFVEYLQFAHNETANNLSSEIEKLADKLAHFQFGLSLVHKRMGVKLKNSDLIISADNIFPSAGPIAHISKDARVNKNYKKRYLLQLKQIYSIINNPEEFNRITQHWGIPNLSMEDLFFLAGVEEASHKMFDEKQNKKVSIYPEDNIPSYHISDIELRALLWKSKIIKKYLPQYIKPMKIFIEKQIQIRSKYKN